MLASGEVVVNVGAACVDGGCRVTLLNGLCRVSDSVGVGFVEVVFVG